MVSSLLRLLPLAAADQVVTPLFPGQHTLTHSTQHGPHILDMGEYKR
jgi:hypothetical protein